MNAYDRFLEICKESGVTPAEVCRKVGYSRSCLKRWKDGQLIPSQETLKRFGDYFDLSSDYFMDQDTVDLASKVDALILFANEDGCTWHGQHVPAGKRKKMLGLLSEIQELFLKN